MKTYFVTRHPGAIAWLAAHYPEISKSALIVQHWTKELYDELNFGDVVIGILPVDLVSPICWKGARFFSLALPNLPAELRGKELSAEQMVACGANIAEFYVAAVPGLDNGPEGEITYREVIKRDGWRLALREASANIVRWFYPSYVSDKNPRTTEQHRLAHGAREMADKIGATVTFLHQGVGE